MNILDKFILNLQVKWEMRNTNPCPPCPSCGHKHRISSCVCGCQDKAWREYPVPFPMHWIVRRVWFWVYDRTFRHRKLCRNCGSKDRITRYDIEQCEDCGYPV